MSEQRDLKETKELLSFVFALVYATSKSLQDGKFEYREALNYVGAVRKLPSAVKGIEQVPAEIRDLTPEEVDELKAFIVEEFDIVNDELEANIEEMLDLAADFAKVAVQLV